MESILSQTDLKEVIKNKFKCSDFEVVEWTFRKDYQSSGFYGLPSKEYVALKLGGEKVVGLHLFIRQIPPAKGYHGELMDKLQVFSKEAVMHDSLLKQINAYIDGKVYPECYLARKDKLIVLEDLNVLGYKSIGITNTFDLDQIESTLKTLSKLHAGSIIFEEKSGNNLDTTYSDALTETYFVPDINHPWFQNGCTSMNAIEAIVEAYFPQTPPEVFEKAYDILRTLPYRIIPSRKYRNVLINGCITAGNVLFKTNEDKEVTESIITNFQQARYNTPALDVLLAILLTTNSMLRSNNFESLLVHYYNNFSRELTEHGIDVKAILTWDQFNESIHDALPTAQAMAIMYLHLLLLPIERISHIIKSDKECQEFIENDRSEIVLEEMRNNNTYRKRMIQAISDIFESVKSNKKIIYN